WTSPRAASARAPRKRGTIPNSRSGSRCGRRCKARMRDSHEIAKPPGDVMKIYYAHPMCMYGGDDESRHLARIRQEFRHCEIVNPADYRDDPSKRRDTVGFCLTLVKGCD